MAAQERMMILQAGKRRRTECAFTLIELVLVMAILIAVLSISGASMTRFFRGRTLDSEAQRFVALTRHAQNRAVSEGLPMSLWIDPPQRKYGLEIAAGFTDRDAKASEFELGRDLEFEIVKSTVVGIVRPMGNEIVLRFGPDGFMDETNPEAVIIKEKEGESMVVAPNRNRLNYEISTNQVYAIRR